MLMSPGVVLVEDIRVIRHFGRNDEMLMPMVNVLASSLSTSEHLIRNDVSLWPKGWNLDAYKAVLGNSKYIWSIGWTAILTVVCTVLSLTLTICTAFPLICKNLRGGTTRA